MIIDSMDLSPRTGRLFSPASRIDLAAEKLGTFGPVPEGVVYEISGLHVYFEMAEIEALLATGDGQLFQLQTRKEIVPGLALDPYAHRMHTIAGREDFSAGSLENGRVEAVDGRDALCAFDGKELDWESAVYTLRQSTDFSAAYWDLLPSRHADGFRYMLAIDVWTGGANPATSTGHPVVLAPEWTTPGQARANDTAAWPAGITSYRLRFRAQSSGQGRLSASSRLGHRDGISRALLRSVTLAETVDHSFTFHSLLELAAASVDGGFQPPHGPARGYSAGIAYAATLEEGDGLSVKLGSAFSPDLFQAHLVGVEHQRPGHRSEG
jgi:hypothetical protein